MNKILKIIPVILAITLIFTTCVFAEDEFISSELPDTGNETIEKVENLAYTTWNTIKLIIQILCVMAIMFAGIRYMFISASQKAEIKKSLGILVVGALLVIACSTIIGIVVDVVTEAKGIVVESQTKSP